MEISFAMRVSVPPNVLIRELDGESVILNLNTGRYFGLDEVGTRMFTVLSTSESIRAALEALLSEYDVDARQLRKDVHNFTLKLVKHGLAEISGK